MTRDQCILALEISEHLFNLTTESLRLRSNETKRYQTLESLLSDRMGLPCVLEDHAPETIRQHLSAIPTTGDIRIDLTITKSSADSLDAVKQLISDGLGSEITLGDTLSVMLFHYVVGQKTARVLQRIGLECSHDSPGIPAASKDTTAGNVVPLR